MHLITWIDYESKEPKNKALCDVLILTESGNLEQELAIFHKGVGFVMRATNNKPCGTQARVVYWKKQNEKN